MSSRPFSLVAANPARGVERSGRAAGRSVPPGDAANALARPSSRQALPLV